MFDEPIVIALDIASIASTPTVDRIIRIRATLSDMGSREATRENTKVLIYRHDEMRVVHMEWEDVFLTDMRKPSFSPLAFGRYELVIQVELAGDQADMKPFRIAVVNRSPGVIERVLGPDGPNAID
jgi:hypothetical protein